MLDLTSSISNEQKYPYTAAEKSAADNTSAEQFSQTLATQNEHTDSSPQNDTNSDDLQSSFNNLLSGTASDEDISSMQNALFNSLKQALFTDSANASGVINQSQTSYKGETTTTSETTTQGDVSNTSETSNTFWELVDSAKTISFGEDGLGLDDAFDAVNVLNHIPIVSDVYKDVTSQDSADAAAAVAGGYMFAGPVGALYSAANAVTEEITGSSILDNFISFGRSFLGDEPSATQTIDNVASAVAASVTDAAAKEQSPAHEFVTRDYGTQGA